MAKSSVKFIKFRKVHPRRRRVRVATRARVRARKGVRGEHLRCARKSRTYHPRRRRRWEKSGTLHRAGAGANVMAVDRGGALSRHFQHRRRRRSVSASLGISRSPCTFMG